MKKLFLALLPIFCICMLTTSCKKEEENENLKVAKQLEGTWVYETTGIGAKKESFTFTAFERAKKFPYINDELGEMSFDGEVRKTVAYVSSTANTDNTLFFLILPSIKKISVFGRAEDGQHWHMNLPYSETGEYEYRFNSDGTLSLNGKNFTKQE